MAKYRRKPVVIEALQFSGSNHLEIAKFTNGSADIRRDDVIVIPTLEGDHNASIGDWIIRGIAGEFYPCKPDIFAKTYEVCDG